MKLSIRRAIMSDAKDIINIILSNQKFRNCYETIPMTINECALFVMNYFSPGHFMYVITDSDRIVCTFFHKFYGNNLVDVHKHTHLDYIGKGIGTETTRLDTEACAGLVIMGMTPETNTMAMQCRINNGYTVLGTIPSSWDNGHELIGRIVSYKVCE